MSWSLTKRFIQPSRICKVSALPAKRAGTDSKHCASNRAGCGLATSTGLQEAPAYCSRTHPSPCTIPRLQFVHQGRTHLEKCIFQPLLRCERHWEPSPRCKRVAMKVNHLLVSVSCLPSDLLWGFRTQKGLPWGNFKNTGPMAGRSLRTWGRLLFVKGKSSEPKLGRARGSGRPRPWYSCFDLK